MTIGLMTIRNFTQLGGSMIMRTQRLQEPGYHEYRMAKCARR